MKSLSRSWFAVLIFLFALTRICTAADQRDLTAEKVTNEKLIQITKQLDELEAKSRNVEQDLSEKHHRLELKLQKYEDDAQKVLALQSSLTTQFLGSQDVAAKLNAGVTQVTDFQKNITRLEEKVLALSQKIDDTSRNAEWTKWFISAVAAVVSILVVLVSLFFSKSFMDLYANYKVLAAFQKRDKEDTEAPAPE